MNKFNRILILLFALLTGCTHGWKDVKAPCTYDKRKHCGPIVLQQEPENPYQRVL